MSVSVMRGVETPICRAIGHDLWPKDRRLRRFRSGAAPIGAARSTGRLAACRHKRCADRCVDAAVKAQHLVLEAAGMQAGVGAACQPALDRHRGGDVLLLEDRLLDQREGLLPIRDPVVAGSVGWNQHRVHPPDLIRSR